MSRVGVSGAAGRIGRLVSRTVAAANDLELGGLYAPGHEGEELPEGILSADPDALAGCDVVVEVTRPDVVMGNLARWRGMGMHVVVGTSGFDASRLHQLERSWGDAPPSCLVVPNFSIGAVVMMRLASLAAPHFAASEVIELHHDRKVDAPSGTALSTAARMAEAGATQHRSVDSPAPARGEVVSGVPVHSVRLPGFMSSQEVLLGSPGEVLTIRHDSTSLESFVPGILLAIRGVGSLERGVSVGLEALLEL